MFPNDVFLQKYLFMYSKEQKYIKYKGSALVADPYRLNE